MTSPTRWTVTTNGILGLWLVGTSFVFAAPPAARWSDVLVGLSVVAIAGYNYHREATKGTINRWATGLSGLLGGWLLVAPFVFQSAGLHRWNDVIVGVGVVSLAMYNIYAAPRLCGTQSRASPEEV